MNEAGFLKLHRRLDGHWITSRADWYAGWIDILMHTAWRTGRVDLTEIPAREFFTRRAWQRFIGRLKDERMLVDCRYGYEPGARGQRLTATIANWEKYQAPRESGEAVPKVVPSPGRKGSRNAGRNDASPTKTKQAHGAESRAESGANPGSESGPSPHQNPVKHDAPEALRSKEVKKGSLQTDQLLTTAAPLEGRKLPREMILMHQCPAEYQRTRGQAWHVWRAANGGDDSLEAWADLYHDHDELLAQLARMKERTKADLPTARGWVLQVAKDAARAPQTALDAMTRILNDPAVKRPWSAYVAAFQNARTVETNTSSRDWALDDLAEHPMYGTLVVNELLPGGRAVTPDGFTFELEGCRRCNN